MWRLLMIVLKSHVCVLCSKCIWSSTVHICVCVQKVYCVSSDIFLSSSITRSFLLDFLSQSWKTLSFSPKSSLLFSLSPIPSRSSPSWRHHLADPSILLCLTFIPFIPQWIPDLDYRFWTCVFYFEKAHDLHVCMFCCVCGISFTGIFCRLWW